MKNICIVVVNRKELFLKGHTKTQLILALYFINMKVWKKIYVYKKSLIRSGSVEMANVLAASKAQNVNRQYVSKLYLQKCISPMFFMIKKHWTLTDNYDDLLNFLANRIQEPITKQYLNSCPKNASYLSNMTAESLLDTMNFCYKSENLSEICDASFACLYTNEAENSCHKNVLQCL